MDFCGLLFNAKVVDGGIKVYIDRSFLRDVAPGDELTQINGVDASKFIKSKINKYIKSTYSDLTAIKKYTLFMCIKNPFDLIKSLTIVK